MAGDYLCALGFAAEQFYHLAGNIAVGGAVRTVTADVVLLVHFVGQRVHVGFRRHGLVERGVKYEHLRNARHYRKTSVNSLEMRTGVKRRKIVTKLKLCQNIVVK